MNISKLRDVLETRDFKTIYNHIYLFNKVEGEIKRQVAKYIKHPDHELDFTYADLKELSDEIYDYIKNFQQKFLYDKYYKEVCKLAPITGKVFNEMSTKIGYEMQLDTSLRAVYKTLAYLSLVVFLWSETDEKKPFDVQITDLIRSFI